MGHRERRPGSWGELEEPWRMVVVGFVKPAFGETNEVFRDMEAGYGFADEKRRLWQSFSAHCCEVVADDGIHYTVTSASLAWVRVRDCSYPKRTYGHLSGYAEIVVVPGSRSKHRHVDTWVQLAA